MRRGNFRAWAVRLIMALETDWTWTTEVRLPSVPGAGRALLDQLSSALGCDRWTERDIFGIRLAVEEALVNAIHHGNRADSNKQIHVSCRVAPQRVLVEVTDEGAGFDPAIVPDCTTRENWERTSGRGILLMKNYMTRVQYLDGGSRVVLEKQRGQPDSL